MSKVAARSITTVLTAILLLTTGVETAFAKKKEGLKGRYLDVDKSIDLHYLLGASVIVEEAGIVADKSKPIDTKAVRRLSEEQLIKELKLSRIFRRVVSARAVGTQLGGPVLRLRTELTLQYGSQAMRMLTVGTGAGKSKLHIRVDLIDETSGELLGYFNGYGTGSGAGSFTGGGVQKLAKDDFQENYKEFVRLLSKRIR